MSLQKEIGVVVVGLGMAGRARVRDLKEKTCGLRLKGVVSRRPVEDADVPALTFDEALNKPDVDAIFISTEPRLHEDYVKKSLESRKHVLVEYPLALSSATARKLHELAEQKGLVLYEENIGLLTEGFNVVKNKVKSVGIKSGQYTLKGSYNGWIEDFQALGLPFVTGISGIQNMLSLFGDVKVVNGKLEKSEDGYTTEADLEANGKPIKITLSRSKSKEEHRRKQTMYEFEDGEVIDSDKIPQTSSKPGLFMRDMEEFYAAILNGKVSDENKFLTIRGLEVAEEIHSFYSKG